MEKIAMSNKAKELKKIIARLEFKIKTEKFAARLLTAGASERVECLNRKLNIFTQLLEKYYSL